MGTHSCHFYLLLTPASPFFTSLNSPLASSAHGAPLCPSGGSSLLAALVSECSSSCGIGLSIGSPVSTHLDTTFCLLVLQVAEAQFFKETRRAFQAIYSTLYPLPTVNKLQGGNDKVTFIWLLAGLLIADRQPDSRKTDSEVRPAFKRVSLISWV